MEAVRRILYVISGLFVLFALLIIFNLLSREFFVLNFGLVNMEEIFRPLSLTAVSLLVLLMIVQGIASYSVNRELQRTQHKVNELKADLYDRRQQALRQRPIPDSQPVQQAPASTAEQPPAAPEKNQTKRPHNPQK